MRAAAAVAASASQRSLAGEPAPQGVGQRAARGLVRRRLIGQARSAARRTCASGSCEQPGGDDRAGRSRVARQDLHRIAPDAGRGMLERGRDRLGRRRGFEPSRAPRPCSVQSAWIAPAFRPIASTERSRDQLDQRGHDVGLAALDQEPLGVQPPELIVVPQRGDQARGVGRDRAPAGGDGRASL